MFRQYWQIKENYPDALLFFRMGDFYEMFFEDARTASAALSLTLTSRNKNDPDPVPMCGIPHHSAERYIARLLAQGHKVAVCDQVEDPALAKGIVKRDVVRVVTPGTITEDAYLAEGSENLLTAVARGRKTWGLASLSVSTADFRVTELGSAQEAADELARIAPQEVLVSEADRHHDELRRVLAALPNAAITWFDKEFFDADKGLSQLCGHFGTQNLEGFGLTGMNAGISAASAALAYASRTQCRQVAHVTRITPYSTGDFLYLDASSVRNLELFSNIATGSRAGSLIQVLDFCATPMGSRLLSRWLRYPLRDISEIGFRQDAVEEAKNDPVGRDAVRRNLSGMGDLERLRSRIVLNRATPRDLLALGRSLAALPDLWLLMSQRFKSGLLGGEVLGDDLSDMASAILDAVRDDAPLSVREGGIFRSGYNADLDEVSALEGDALGFLARLEAAEKERTGISTLKVRFNKVFGYYIEVPKSQAERVPAHYVRRQTLVNAERFITDELKTFEEKVLGAGERKKSLEYELFQALRERVATEASRIWAAALHLARVDTLFALAEAADKNGYRRPLVNGSQRIEITEGRHPVVEKTLEAGRYVPNSIMLDMADCQVLIITGPNMAGKSTVLRQTAVTAIMAQMGSFVPASRAEIGVCDRIFTRVGALDNLSLGQSTFMVEMQETANILNNATKNSLVMVDEIGRGTSTFDGLSIAWAVAEYLHDLKGSGVKTLFATHYHELTELSQSCPRVKNFHIAVKETADGIVFLRRLAPGGTNKSHGIAVARLAGVPELVVERAGQILSVIESSEADRLRRAVRSRKIVRKRQGSVQLTLFFPEAENGPSEPSETGSDNDFTPEAGQ